MYKIAKRYDATGHKVRQAMSKGQYGLFLEDLNECLEGLSDTHETVQDALADLKTATDRSKEKGLFNPVNGSKELFEICEWAYL